MLPFTHVQLATWTDVNDFMAATHAPIEDIAGGISARVTLPTGTVHLELGPHTVDGRPWLRVTGVIAPVRNILPSWCVTSSGTSSVGILAIANGSLIARQLLPLATTRQNLTDVVTALAYQCLIGRQLLDG